ncbi:MAG: class I SAM-dependent methyltransferase [Myxococcaceae bacterium]|nr:class I SAM-dependent methyltransferase [Myxococcaceae bacterium]MBH2005879.1 class I SAM-dependent methyltransferase [Myxococcaceae bacterium]
MFTNTQFLFSAFYLTIGALAFVPDPSNQASWERKAHCWDVFVGPNGEGDRNRFHLSDPKLLELLGDVTQKTVLDIGCGNGYLSRRIRQLGASKVVGVDLPAMIEIARGYGDSGNGDRVDFRMDDARILESIQAPETFDSVVANYVLMDLSDYRAALAAAFRVLKTGGIAIIVILHPAFPLEPAVPGEVEGVMAHRISRLYFEQHVQHIKVKGFPKECENEEFIVFHRSLEEYRRAFEESGFIIERKEVPKPTLEQKTVLTDLDSELYQKPISIVFKLRKPSPILDAIHLSQAVSQEGTHNLYAEGNAIQISGLSPEALAYLDIAKLTQQNPPKKPKKALKRKIKQTGLWNLVAEGNGIQLDIQEN